MIDTESGPVLWSSQKAKSIIYQVLKPCIFIEKAFAIPDLQQDKLYVCI